MSSFEDGQVIAMSVEQLFLSIHFLMNSGLNDLANRSREQMFCRGHGDEVVGIVTGGNDSCASPFATIFQERHFVELFSFFVELFPVLLNFFQFCRSFLCFPNFSLVSVFIILMLLYVTGLKYSLSCHISFNNTLNLLFDVVL